MNIDCEQVCVYVSRWYSKLECDIARRYIIAFYRGGVHGTYLAKKAIWLRDLLLDFG